MINLLPIEKKKQVIAEQKLRVISFYLYIVGICFIIALVALLPSYFPAIVRNHIAKQKLEKLNSLPVSELDHETTSIIADVNSKIALVNAAEKNKFLVLESAINEVIAKKMPDIKIIAFDYDKESDGTKKIVIRGLAPNRTRLLLFRQALESDKNFSAVDLPISNFVKGSNIDFTLNITSGWSTIPNQ